jgi:hypothetical protein
MSTEKKSKGGRPKKHINYDVLDECCRIHCTGEECAAIQCMSYELLNHHLKEDGHGGFLDYFQLKSADGKRSLRRRQYQAAEEGNPAIVNMDFN